MATDTSAGEHREEHRVIGYVVATPLWGKRESQATRNEELRTGIILADAGHEVELYSKQSGLRKTQSLSFPRKRESIAHLAE